jgi:hypothetical protein
LIRVYNHSSEMCRDRQITSQENCQFFLETRRFVSVFEIPRTSLSLIYNWCNLCCSSSKCEHISLIFTFSELKISEFSNVNTNHHIEGSTDFYFPNPISSNLFEFPATKSHSKINIFHTLALKIMKQILLNLTC